MHQIFLATKFGVKFSSDEGRVFRNDPAYIRQAIGLSLERLGIETVDLWYWYVVPTLPSSPTTHAWACYGSIVLGTYR